MKIDLKRIQLICVLYIIAWMLAPPLAYDTIYRLLAIIAAVIWVLVHLIVRNDTQNRRVKRCLRNYLICVCIYGIVLFSFRCIFGEMSLWAAFYTDIPTYILLFVGYIGGVYCKEQRYNDLKIICYFALIIAVFFSLTSIFRDSAYYEFTRNAGGDNTEEYNILAREAAMHGVGAFGFFCFTSILSPLILWYSYSQKRFRKAVAIVAFIIVELGVLSAGYTLALIISFVGIVCCVWSKMNSVLGKFLVVMGAIVILLGWNTFLNGIHTVLANISRGSMYEVKVDDIFSFLLDGDSEGTFAARQERYAISLETIIKYPLFGSYMWEGIRTVGGHSSILDTLATYGWLVGGAWIYIIILFPCNLATESSKEYRIMVLIMLFLTALFNQYVMMMGTFCFLVPAINSVSLKRNE